MLRRNTVKERLAAGKIVFGGVVSDVVQAELLGLLGFDYLQVDGEHFPLTPTELEHITRAGDSGGAVTVVRLATSDPGVMMPFLETGVLGLQAAHCMNANDARALVAATKYPPIGARGKGGGRVGGYGTIKASQHIKEWNENFMTIAQVEDKEALDQLPEILAVPGVDGVAIGLADLAVSLGSPDDREAPVVWDAVVKMTRTIRDAGKWCAVSNATDIKRYIDVGVQSFKWGALPMLRARAAETLAKAHAIAG
jgi:4-hydroxy-2-oxoheptanedioate aldolase